MIQYSICQSDELVEQFVSFVLRHREELSPSQSLRDTIAMICRSLPDSQMSIGRNKDGEVVSASAYYAGPPGKRDPDAGQVTIELVLVRDDYRKTLLPAQTMADMILSMAETGKTVERVYLLAYPDNDAVNRFYAKLGRRSGRHEDAGGAKNVYVAEYSSLYETAIRLAGGNGSPA